jgi:protein-tyrosine phosphatase
MKRILFVCLGNICRSPLAQAIAQDLVLKQNIELEIDSCGTGHWHVGEAPCENSIKVASQRGLDISSYKARQVVIEDFAYYDYIIGLDESNVNNLKNLGCKEVLKLGDFGHGGDDVPDPYFFDGFEGFDRVFDMIESCVKEFLNQKIAVK